MTITIRFGAPLLVCVGAAVTNLAHAQVADTTTPLNEIIVTAEKRAQPVQEVPAVVDVLTGTDLDALQITQAPQIAQTVPNLVIAKNDTYTNSTIEMRGITQANNSDVPVAVIVDGVPQDDPKQFNTFLYDIQSIQVLKGPQGSLYGRDAEAGAIIITTAAPTNHLTGQADFTAGSGASYTERGEVSDAIVPDTLLFRVSGYYESSDGQILNVFRRDHSDYIDYDRGLRGDIQLRISPRVKLDVTGQFRDFDVGTTYFAPVFSADANDIEDPQSDFPGKDRGQQTFASAKLEADLGFATLTSVSGYARIAEHQVSDVDFTNPIWHPEVFQVGDNQPSDDRVVSQDLRLVSPSAARLRWLASADYLESSSLLSTNIFADTGQFAVDPYEPALLLVSSSATNRRTDYGLSGQVDYDVLSDLTLTGGLRYDHDQREQTNLANGQRRQADFGATQPKVTVRYELDPDRILYATYGVGFRSGGFNPPNFSIPIFGEEKLTNYEVGFKSQWLQRRLTINAAAFTGHIDGYQYSYIDFRTASPVTGSIDRVRISGGELETHFRALAGLDLFANVGVSVPTISKSTLFPQYVGNETPRAQNYSFQAGFDYSRALSAGLSWFIGSNAVYYSREYWYVDNLDVQKPKTYLNARLGLQSGQWTLTLWGKNITDTRAYETYDPNQATGAGRDVGLPNEPASFGGELTWRF
jgi:iron complex outermembrane recepter protein